MLQNNEIENNLMATKAYFFFRDILVILKEKHENITLLNRLKLKFSEEKKERNTI